MGIVTETGGALRVCPDCGSPSVEFSGLVGGSASCKPCSWTGSMEDLYTVPLPNKPGSDDQIFLSMYNDFRGMFSRHTSDYLRFLIKWGFVSAVDRGGNIEITDKNKVMRYINGMLRGALKGVLDLREELEKETVSGSV